MPGRQQTFDLIPTSLVRSTGQKPPMTSKAAKKAYLKANRTPRLSRAEQRRLEAEERARQKEEYDNERNAQRARAARERKAQKEQAQRDARKKMGLPEPSKFVRASQPTISRFVVTGGKRSWQAMEAVTEESDGTICEREDDDCPPAKRVALGDDSEEEFGDFPSLSQSDLPALLDNIDTPKKLLKAEEEEGEMEGEVEGEKEVEGSPELPRRRSIADKEDYTLEDEGMIDEMITAQLLSEAVEASSRPDDALPLATLSNRSNTIPVFADKVNTGTEVSGDKTRETRYGKTRQALAERPMNVPSPAKAAKTISFAPTPPKNRHSALAIDEGNYPPSATQIFLENHLNDFFPSPSQEIRELLEDADALPSNTQITRELNPDTSIDDDLVARMFSSQDFVLSSQDIREITTPSRPPARQDGGSMPAQAQSLLKQKGLFFEEKDEDLLQAAIHESKVVAERERQQKEPPKKPSGPTKRTLQRVQSTATDYGDEEFSAYEKELLALF